MTWGMTRVMKFAARLALAHKRLMFSRRERRPIALFLCIYGSLLSGCATIPDRQSAPTSIASAPLPDFTLRLIGERRLDHRLAFGGTIVGGLSGIDYDPASDLYYLISDDRSVFSPTRFYTARLKIDEHAFADVALQTVVTLMRPDNTPYPPHGSDDAADAEAIRFDRGTRSLWWTSEGERTPRKRRGGPRLIDPFIRQSALDGRYLGEIPLDPMFRISAQARGPRDNRVFEGATLAVDTQSLWVAMEGPLIQDGPMPTRDRGAWSRFSRHDRMPSRSFGSLAVQLAYPIDPIPAESAWTIAYAVNGVSEILAIDATRFLVLERAFILGLGWRVRLYQADASHASDIRTIESLAPDSGGRLDFVPMEKRLVLDLDTLGIAIDNLEGLCFGPTLSNGHRTLILVSDDNFNPGQVTQFLAFEIVPDSRGALPRITNDSSMTHE